MHESSARRCNVPGGQASVFSVESAAQKNIFVEKASAVSLFLLDKKHTFL